MDYQLKIAQSIHIEGLSETEIYPLLEPPKDPAMGDFALPCFKLARVFKKAPDQIAKELQESVGKADFLESCEAVGGYLNFKLNKRMYAETVLDAVLRQAENYGGSDKGAGKTICVDYSSINIAKPFHIGHLFTTVLGASLCRIYQKLGYRTVGINHLGDWGTQFGKLIVAYKRWGNQAVIEKGGVRALLEIYVKYHDEAEKDPSLDDEARAWFKKIEDADPEAMQIFEWFKALTLKEVDAVYRRLHVSFDSYAGESFYNDKMQPVLDELQQKGLLETSDGAKVVRFEGDEMPPCLLVKADGATLYATRDIAAAFYRKKTYDFDKCLYVVAYQQNLHFKQFFKVIEKMGYAWASDLVHVAFGMVSLEDGAMSTRKGKVAFLDEALDRARDKALEIIEQKNPAIEGKQVIAEQVGIGALIFGVLQNNRIKDIVFSYDKILNFDGETAPYVQYTHARANSVLKKAAPSDEAPDFAGLDNREGHELIKMLDRFPVVIENAAERFEPSFIARYAVDLAQLFNKFYYEHKINDPDARVRRARLMLSACVKTVLETAFGLLGIECPEEM